MLILRLLSLYLPVSVFASLALTLCLSVSFTASVCMLAVDDNRSVLRVEEFNQMLSSESKTRGSLLMLQQLVVLFPVRNTPPPPYVCVMRDDGTIAPVIVP